MVQPKASLPLPQGDDHMIKKLLGAGGGALGGNFMTNGLLKWLDDGNGVLGQATQQLSHDENEIHPCRSAS